MKEKIQYCFSLSDNYFTTGEKTIKKTLKEAFNNATEDDFIDGVLKVKVGIIEYYNDDKYLDFEDVIEKMKDIAYDEGGEFAENYLEGCSGEDLKWAQEKFLHLWQQFKKRTGNREIFFTAKNIAVYYLDKKGELI